MLSCLFLVHEEPYALCLGAGPVSWAQRGKHVLGSVPFTFNPWQKEPACRLKQRAVPGSAWPDRVTSGCPWPHGLQLIPAAASSALRGAVGMCRMAHRWKPSVSVLIGSDTASCFRSGLDLAAQHGAPRVHVHTWPSDPALAPHSAVLTGPSMHSASRWLWARPCPSLRDPGSLPPPAFALRLSSLLWSLR